MALQIIDKVYEGSESGYEALVVDLTAMYNWDSVVKSTTSNQTDFFLEGSYIRVTLPDTGYPELEAGSENGYSYNFSTNSLNTAARAVRFVKTDTSLAVTLASNRTAIVSNNSSTYSFFFASKASCFDSKTERVIVAGKNTTTSYQPAYCVFSSSTNSNAQTTKQTAPVSSLTARIEPACTAYDKFTPDEIFTVTLSNLPANGYHGKLAFNDNIYYCCDQFIMKI